MTDDELNKARERVNAYLAIDPNNWKAQQAREAIEVIERLKIIEVDAKADNKKTAVKDAASQVRVAGRMLADHLAQLGPPPKR